jgi:hypothetical protein
MNINFMEHPETIYAYTVSFLNVIDGLIYGIQTSLVIAAVDGPYIVYGKSLLNAVVHKSIYCIIYRTSILNAVVDKPYIVYCIHNIAPKSCEW